MKFSAEQKPALKIILVYQSCETAEQFLSMHRWMENLLKIYKDEDSQRFLRGISKASKHQFNMKDAMEVLNGKVL